MMMKITLAALVIVCLIPASHGFAATLSGPRHERVCVPQQGVQTTDHNVPLQQQEIIRPSFDSKGMESFARELEELNRGPWQQKAGNTFLATQDPIHTTTFPTLRTPTAPSSIKSFSREILRHAILSTLLARFCFPRIPLSPLIMTVAMTILKRKEVLVRSHQW
ncbi:expressed unknown protein [Seminavis robusta]|uniref:Uncharacterized protein n=1 Tax=Seminavis robusta TaxID=568900 RepID=A0A9N8DJQ7_9STRA|nr:expressed unknown protein [Seminavis robusta]|eukprot:Sro123_g059680.1 n/a (164) ;mRNA; r:88473-88964